MKFIILHGAPGAGKLTIAKKLSDMTGYKILHNHLTVDLALSVHNGFDDDGFGNFVNELRIICLQRALKNNIPGLIFTLVHNKEIDEKIIKKIINLVEQNQGTVFPVFLNPNIEVLKSRVKKSSRLGTNKITDPDFLDELLSAYSMDPIVHMNTIEIDNSGLSVKKVCKLIIKRL